MKTILMAVSLSMMAGVMFGDEMLKPGDTFPSWEMTDHTGAKVTSASLQGKTYLLWYYPKAMTSGCTKEGCALRDSSADFEKTNVVILGVSFDTPDENAEFVKRDRFPFRLLSDDTRELAVKVGAADSAASPRAKRISYLVGPDGKVLKAYPTVSPGDHAAEVLADMKALKK